MLVYNTTLLSNQIQIDSNGTVISHKLVNFIKNGSKLFQNLKHNGISNHSIQMPSKKLSFRISNLWTIYEKYYNKDFVFDVFVVMNIFKSYGKNESFNQN